MRRVSLRSALRAPSPALRCSSPQKSPPPGTACRDVEPVVLRLAFNAKRTTHAGAKARAGRPAARLGGGEERRARGPRAQRASTTDSSTVFERSERSERSEFG